MQYILISFAIISLKFKELVAIRRWLLVVSVSSHGAVGWSAVYDSGHTHLLGCMRRYRTGKYCIRHEA